MKKQYLISGVVLVSLLITACSSKDTEVKMSVFETSNNRLNKTSGYINITPEDAKKCLQNEKGIILLDVRTVDEYTEKHIPGSILLPVNEVENRASELLPEKNAKIFVYCRSGRRSITASETLIKMGYNNVFNLGGIIDWPFETKTGIYE